MGLEKQRGRHVTLPNLEKMDAPNKLEWDVMVLTKHFFGLN